MSISSRISSMEEHVTNAYNGLQGLGADLTGIDKNIDNIADVLDDIYDDLPKVTDEDTSITLDDTRVGRLSTTLKGNTSQTGTPTPSSPIPVNVVSGDNEINVVGKNLVKVTNGNLSRNNTTLTIQDNVINLKTTGDTTYVAYGIDNTIRNANYGDYVSWGNMTLSAGTYTLSTKYLSGSTTTTGAEGNFIRCVVYGRTVGSTDNVSTELSRVLVTNSSNSNTFTTSQDMEVNIVIYMYTNQTPTVDINFQVQLEKSSTATSFEPYQGNTYNIDLPEGMELCSSQDGTKRDYLLHDKTLDKWYWHREIGKVVLNGSETIEIYNQNTSRTNFEVRNILSGVEEYTDSSVMPNLLSNRFISNTQGATWVVGNMSRRNVEGVNEYLYLTYEPSTTVEAFKTWLGTNNVPVYYVYATPTNTEITYQPLIDQLNELERAMSKDGQTNISQVNNDLPFKITASALKEWSV